MVKGIVYRSRQRRGDQPADLVTLTGYPFNNALLRLSDIGEAYDPHTGQGVGDSAYPQATGHDPTCTIGALAYWSANAITSQYLKAPGPLVHA
jgi:hypothetical protein